MAVMRGVGCVSAADRRADAEARAAVGATDGRPHRQWYSTKPGEGRGKQAVQQALSEC